jgi:hypothetical protein
MPKQKPPSLCIKVVNIQPLILQLLTVSKREGMVLIEGFPSPLPFVYGYTHFIISIIAAVGCVILSVNLASEE